LAELVAIGVLRGGVGCGTLFRKHDVDAFQASSPYKICAERYAFDSKQSMPCCHASIASHHPALGDHCFAV
jgi:hypothetical protein